MKLTVDTDAGWVSVEGDPDRTRVPLASAEAFALVSETWLRAGWDAKYVYSFTWLGRPIIQLPEDMFRLQEVIYRTKPDVIVETGVAHGGALVFYAGLCRLIGKGRVIGVDVEIRAHNRAALEAHELFDAITLIEGDSSASTTLAKVKAAIGERDSVLVLLDSNHARSHVLAELDAYAPLVTPGSYIVAMDGIMEKLVGAPRSQPDWRFNNPCQAVREWTADHPEFVVEEPQFLFNEGMVRERVTYWPDAYLRRLR
ncbi:MAG: cephalosporin hydroxylase family protein [Methylobacteriaceae bacterium]|nr:cephalosporin hydroxylase family protein [Methylobacteriaceae bacterium]